MGLWNLAKGCIKTAVDVALVPVEVVADVARLPLMAEGASSRTKARLESIGEDLDELADRIDED